MLIQTEVNQAFSPKLRWLAAPVSDTVRAASVVSALSRALDLSTGQPWGHSSRSCILGMRLANEIGLSTAACGDLFYAVLLKDCGCSGNASKVFHALGSDDLKAKRDVKTTDWTRTSWETLQYALSHVAPGKPFLERSKALFRMASVQKAHAKDVTKIRCERGSTLARLMGLSAATADGILNLDEHWDGTGNPVGLTRTEIPVISQLALLAQTLEVFAAAQSPQTAVDVVNRRSRKWFNPDLVKATNSLAGRGDLWTDLFHSDASELCLRMEQEPKQMNQGDTNLDNICMAFSNIVDAKSPFTFNHSVGVAAAAVAMGQTFGLSKERIVFLRHAALLHDLGKLSVSNSILEKPAKLEEDEWKVMKEHPAFTWKILKSIPNFEDLCEVAGSHHEKLDGSGYFRGVTAAQIPLEARILAVADVFDALSAKRPYRDSLPRERVFEIMRKDSPHALDAACLEALDQSGTESNQTFLDLQTLKEQLGSSNAFSA